MVPGSLNIPIVTIFLNPNCKSWPKKNQICKNHDFMFSNAELQRNFKDQFLSEDPSSYSSSVHFQNLTTLRQFKNSSKIFKDCKFFEYLRRYEDFQREMENFCNLEMSLCPSLEQNLMDEKQNFFDGNYSYIFSSNVHIFWNLLDNFFQKNVMFPKNLRNL